MTQYTDEQTTEGEAFAVVGTHRDNCPMPGITDSFVKEMIKKVEKMRVAPVQAWYVEAQAGQYLVTLDAEGEPEYWQRV